MSRIPLVKVEDASEEVAGIYAALEGAFKKVPNMFRVLANHPPAMRPMLELFDAFYEQSSVDPRLLEFVVIKIAYGYQSHYCLTLHKAFALERGLTNTEIRAMADSANWENFSEKEQALLAFTDQFQKDPNAIPDELFARMKEHFDDGQIVNLTYLMGLASLFGQTANALKIPIDSFIGASADA